MSGLTAILRRELRLAVGQPGDLLMPPLFFVTALALFPFGLGTDKQVLINAAPAVIWVMASLTLLLRLEPLIRRDHANGVLDGLMISPILLMDYLAGKLLGYWLTSVLPLIVVTPLVSLLYFAPADLVLALVAALVLGTPALAAIGLIAACLSLGARQAGLLVPLITLPLMVPVVIFGVAGPAMWVAGEASLTPWYALAAITLLMLPLSLLASATALKSNRG